MRLLLAYQELFKPCDILDEAGKRLAEAKKYTSELLTNYENFFTGLTEDCLLDSYNEVAEKTILLKSKIAHLLHPTANELSTIENAWNILQIDIALRYPPHSG